MKIWQRFASFLLIAALVFVLSACGSSLEKPTGLEDQQQQEEIQPQPEEQAVEDEPAETEDQKGQLAESEKVKGTEKKETNKPADAKNEPAVKSVPEKPATKQGETKPAAAEKSTVQKETKPTVKPTPEKPAPKPETKPVEKPAATPAPQDKPAVKPDPKPTPPAAKPTASKIVYSIVISSSEVPLPPTEMEITDGDTVLKTLIEITKKHTVQMDYRGGQGSTAYVEGIDNVYEFDRGQGSGWMYRVNGIFPDRGAGAVPLQDGDRVEWLYTTNLGTDLNANLKPFRR